MYSFPCAVWLLCLWRDFSACTMNLDLSCFTRSISVVFFLYCDDEAACRSIDLLMYSVTCLFFGDVVSYSSS